MNTMTTKFRTTYDSCGLREDLYYDLIYELINFAKEKELTTRQAQKLFIDSADAILDKKLK
ncbi:hypothetical protein AALB39_04570 [Lachnospiraceae bacterium 54-53]